MRFLWQRFFRAFISFSKSLLLRSSVRRITSCGVNISRPSPCQKSKFLTKTNLAWMSLWLLFLCRSRRLQKPPQKILVLTFWPAWTLNATSPRFEWGQSKGKKLWSQWKIARQVVNETQTQDCKGNPTHESKYFDPVHYNSPLLSDHVLRQSTNSALDVTFTDTGAKEIQPFLINSLLPRQHTHILKYFVLLGYAIFPNIAIVCELFISSYLCFTSRCCPVLTKAGNIRPAAEHSLNH